MTEPVKPHNKFDDQISKANYAAIIIILLSIILLIIVIGKLFLTGPQQKITKEIKITYELKESKVTIDQLKDSNSIEYFKIIEANNRKLIGELNKSLGSEYSRIQKIIDSKEEQNIYNSYGAGLIALIIGVAGFFGFKSINEMKKDAIETAESEAKKIAEDTAKNTSTMISEKVAKREARERYPRLKEELIREIQLEFNGRFDDKELQVSDDFQNNINNIVNEKYKELNEKYDQLRGRIDICCPDAKNNDSETPRYHDDIEVVNIKKDIEGLYSDDDIL